jgi:tetratricopeptide (TPR) repeat protein
MDYYGAITDFNKAIELDPNDDDAYYNRGRSKHSLKDHSGAIEDYTKAIELSPSSHSYNNRGDAKEELGNLDGACSDWKKAANLGHTNGKWIANQCN